MNIQITSRKFRAKDNLKEFITDELKSLEKITDEIFDVDVILSFQHQKDSLKTAEIVARVPHKVLKASVTTEEFKKSVSFAIEKIEKQIERRKTKIIDTKRVEKIHD